MDKNKYIKTLFVNKYYHMKLSDCKLKSYMNDIDSKDRELGLYSSIFYVWEIRIPNLRNKVVAMVTIEKWKSGWIGCNGLEVMEQFRGIGIGDEVVEFCKKKGVNNLSVEPDNELAINLYKKHGFVFNGQKEGCLLRMELCDGDYKYV